MIIPYNKAVSKWTAKKNMALSTAALLRKATISPSEYIKDPIAAAAYWNMRADVMESCSTRIIYNYCPDCGSMHIAKTNLCRDRLCPVCSWRLALQRSGEMMATLNHLVSEGFPIKGAMITLTIKNIEIEDLSEAIEVILDSWSRLRKRTIWKRWVAGYARSIEITRGKEGYHPHMHIFVLWADGYKKDITQRALCDMWRESLRVEYTPICDIRTAYCSDNVVDANAPEWKKLMSAAIESTKYALSGKVTAGIDKANELAQLALAVKNRRLLAYGGIISDARKALMLHDEDTPSDVADMTIECPKCGGGMVSLAYEWAAGGYLLGLNPQVLHAE